MEGRGERERQKETKRKTPQKVRNRKCRNWERTYMERLTRFGSHVLGLLRSLSVSISRQPRTPTMSPSRYDEDSKRAGIFLASGDAMNAL